MRIFWVGTTVLGPLLFASPTAKIHYRSSFYADVGRRVFFSFGSARWNKARPRFRFLYSRFAKGFLDKEQRGVLVVDFKCMIWQDIILYMQDMNQEQQEWLFGNVNVNM